jgi:hypothetical protein
LSLIASIADGFTVAWLILYFIWCCPIALYMMSPQHPFIVFHMFSAIAAIIVFHTLLHDTSIVLIMLLTYLTTIALHTVLPNIIAFVCCTLSIYNQSSSSSLRCLVIPLSSIVCHMTS